MFVRIRIMHFEFTESARKRDSGISKGFFVKYFFTPIMLFKQAVKCEELNFHIHVLKFFRKLFCRIY